MLDEICFLHSDGLEFNIRYTVYTGKESGSKNETDNNYILSFQFSCFFKAPEIQKIILLQGSGLFKTITVFRIIHINSLFRVDFMKYCTVTDTGKIRQNNEDYIAVYEQHSSYGIESINTDHHGKLFVLCDGMGGVPGGAVASKMACEMLMKEYYTSDHSSYERYEDPGYLLSVMIKDISRRIMIHGLNNTRYYGMGTTLVSLLIKGENSYINSVGDSRLYCFRNNDLRQITEDQSLVWPLYKKGILTKDELRMLPENNIITYAVGAEVYLTAENVNRYSCAHSHGDIFLICSDGLTDMVPETLIRDLICQTDNLEKCAENLISAALDEGGRDNISIVLVRI